MDELNNQYACQAKLTLIRSTIAVIDRNLPKVLKQVNDVLLDTVQQVQN